MPKLTKLRKVFILLIIGITLFSLTGCSKKENDDENLKKEKIDQEMKYLDSKIITTMNRLNNISFSNYKVVSEDLKENKTENTSGNEKNNTNQTVSESGSDSSSSNSGSDNGSEGDSNGSSTQGGKLSSSQGGQSSKDSENSQIFKMSQDVLLLNVGEQSQEIKWEEIRENIENLYTIWATITIDLTSVGVNKDDILEFNVILDDIASNAEYKNKDEALNNLSKLYSLIPNYMQSYDTDELIKKIITTKSYVLKAYALANSENWSEISKELTKANESFEAVMTNSSNYSNKELNINRSYLLLEELAKSTEKKDKQIFYLRYKNLMQELSILY